MLNNKKAGYYLVGLIWVFKNLIKKLKNVGIYFCTEKSATFYWSHSTHVRGSFEKIFDFMQGILRKFRICLEFGQLFIQSGKILYEKFEGCIASLQKITAVDRFQCS